MVEGYSSREISRHSDPFHAISGLAAKVQMAPPADDIYAAGLWTDPKNKRNKKNHREFLHRLMWQPPHYRQIGIKEPLRPREYLAPSWLWATTAT